MGGGARQGESPRRGGGGEGSEPVLRAAGRGAGRDRPELETVGRRAEGVTRQTGTTEAAAARGLEEFRARIQAELTEWQPEIEQLKARAAETTAEAKRLAQQLRAKGQAATERLKTLKRTAGESWEEIRPAIEKAWAELRPALMSAASKFKETQPRSDTATTESSARPEPRAARARGVSEKA